MAVLAKAAQWLDNQQSQIRQWHWVALLVLLTSIIATALGVEFSTHTTRHLLNNLQQLVQQQNELQVEWGQLLLEQSSLVAQGQVEEIAIGQLGMEVPAMDKVVVFTGD
ncbi:MAG TPA: cell division protein FtsL [Candidatus Acidoferrum sp.]|nr:cell division protein FtsL [Candidatus Acidoferrum sp.]